MPERTCVGCRRRGTPADLERISRAPDGTLRLGPRLGGRGAWVCAGSRDCLHRAIRRHALARALRAPLSAAAVADLEARWDDLHRDEGSAVRAGADTARD